MKPYIVYMPKGNIPIDKSLAKEVENGKVIQILPDIPINRVRLPLFGTVRKSSDSRTLYLSLTSFSYVAGGKTIS